MKIYRCPICGGEPTSIMFTGDSPDDVKEIAFGCLHCKISSPPVVIPSTLIKETDFDTLHIIANTFAIVRWNHAVK